MLLDREIDRLLAKGFQPSAGGRLAKGAGKEKREYMPSPMLPSKSGDLNFNPRLDAFAVRMGGVFEGDNRYRLPHGLLVDRNGMCRDPEECPECGSLHGEDRFFVRVASANPFASKREQIAPRYTHCRRCVTPEELAENDRRVLAIAPRRRA